MATTVEIETTVRLYNVSMQIFDTARTKLGLEVHEIKYEELIVSLQKKSTDLLGFLGLDWEQSLMNFSDTAKVRGRVYTPSYSQVVQPLYTDAKYRWTKYRSYLDQHLDKVQPWIEKFEYASI